MHVLTRASVHLPMGMNLREWITWFSTTMNLETHITKTPRSKRTSSLVHQIQQQHAKTTSFRDFLPRMHGIIMDTTIQAHSNLLPQKLKLTTSIPQQLHVEISLAYMYKITMETPAKRLDCWPNIAWDTRGGTQNRKYQHRSHGRAQQNRSNILRIWLVDAKTRKSGPNQHTWNQHATRHNYANRHARRRTPML